MLPILMVLITLALLTVPQYTSSHPCTAAFPPTPAGAPVYHILFGTTVNADVVPIPLCETNITNPVLLLSLCQNTPSCNSFTVGSGGGESGDLPPHDCRGSQLFSIPSGGMADSTSPHPGIDLHVLGPANSSNVTNTVTPKPMLQTYPTEDGVLAISKSLFKIMVVPGTATHNVLEEAMSRYTELVFVGNEHRTDRSSKLALGTMENLTVEVLNTTAALALGVSEAYNISIRVDGHAELIADTVWGAIRGLETFAHLVVTGVGATPEEEVYFVDATTICDKPKYQYRGFMIDTARHFLPVAAIFTAIEGMAIEKLNVLHWHAVDDQSFPMEVVSLPRLARVASFSPREHTYSVENITAVVSFARSRGIRVMLEIDTPGHCQCVQEAYPELGLITECPGTTCWPPLDVSKNTTLEFVRTVWRDLTEMFPDNSVFIGGDECHTTCWAENAAVVAWAHSKNLSITAAEESVGGEGTVFGWYIDQVVDIVHGEIGKRPVMWSPLFWDPASPPKNLVKANALLNLWTGNLNELAFNMTTRGTNEVIVSAPWYLPASDSYHHEPTDVCSANASSPYFCSAEQRARIIGGEACMWGEGKDVTNFFSLAWPDLSAVAERLWSSNTADLDLLTGRQRRLRVHRCRLVSRGVPVPPMACVYVPDASHASYATWRKYQYCAGDNVFGYNGPHASADALAWGRVRAAAIRTANISTPFD
eukprot:m.378376 g.378376  ORF g.378376 m.378376 type:complete len:707 (+) comp20930_c0_seq1:139-2259(+)